MARVNLGPAQVELGNLMAGRDASLVLTVTDSAGAAYTPTVCTLHLYTPDTLTPVDSITGTITTGQVSFDLADVTALAAGSAVYRYEVVADDASWLVGPVDLRAVNSGRGVSGARTTTALTISNGQGTVTVTVNAAGVTAAAFNAHVDDTDDAHDATAISYAGSTGISATTVEGALDELDTEKAPLASPTFTGTPVAPTAAAGTNTTQVATTAFVQVASRRPPALVAWDTALASRGTRSVNVVSIGDSIAGGYEATDFRYIWQQRLQTIINSLYPVSGVSTSGRGFIAPVISGAFATFTWPATATVSLQGGFGANRCSISLTAGQSATYTLSGDAIDIVVARGSTSGTLSYTIDGGSAVTWATAFATLTPGYRHRVSLGTNAAHTVVIAHSSGGTVTLEGVIEYAGDTTAGVQVHACGNAGETSGSWLTWLTASVYTKTSIANMAPDLLLIELGTNDMDTNVAVATYKSNLTSVITTIQAQCLATNGTTPTAVVIAGAKSGAAEKADWPLFVQAMREIVAADPFTRVFVDQSTRMHEYTGDTTNSWAATNHPNDLGHSLKAQLVADAIL